MRVITEVTGQELELLRIKARSHHQNGFLQHAITKAHCYSVSLDESDFGNLVMNSCPENPHPECPTFYLLKETVRQVEADDRLFLKQTSEGLDGERIAYHLARFESGQLTLDSESVYILDEAPGFPGKGPYIIDGMHRLVAYGIWPHRSFPILIYYCTENKMNLYSEEKDG